jgi:hypothetical protein
MDRFFHAPVYESFMPELILFFYFFLKSSSVHGFLSEIYKESPWLEGL